MPWRAVVERALEEGQRLGAIGPGPVGAHIEHASALATLIPPEAGRGMDLGTGVGLPGLVLAALRPEVRWVLVDAAARRLRVVAEAVAELGWEDRVDVVHGRAAVLATDPALAGGFDVVVCRSFAGPATTAEEARPFLVLGGRLIVTEPPEAPVAVRWPADGLGALGLALGPRLERPHVQVLETVGPPEQMLPRRDGVARKRPRW